MAAYVCQTRSFRGFGFPSGNSDRYPHVSTPQASGRIPNPGNNVITRVDTYPGIKHEKYPGRNSDPSRNPTRPSTRDTRVPSWS
eukprot:2237408-Rhodomonas_salina.2